MDHVLRMLIFVDLCAVLSDEEPSDPSWYNLLLSAFSWPLAPFFLLPRTISAKYGLNSEIPSKFNRQKKKSFGPILHEKPAIISYSLNEV